MKFQLRLPLYARIVLWFLLNVAVLALAFDMVVRLQFRQGMSGAGQLGGGSHSSAGPGLAFQFGEANTCRVDSDLAGAGGSA